MRGFHACVEIGTYEAQPQLRKWLRILNTRLKIVMDDISVFTMIPKMTERVAKCVQMKKFGMLRGENVCTKEMCVLQSHRLAATSGTIVSSISRLLAGEL